MEDITTYAKAITENMEKLLAENNKILILLSSENPELADQIMQDVNETMKAVRENDMNQINKIYERYADNITK